jgi:hypothetical protein
MAISLFQKIRLLLRGWQRRREERDREFVKRSVSWAPQVSGPGPARAPAAHQTAARRIDMEGLQVAFLDDSGRIDHYLDVESGDIIELPFGATRPDVVENTVRYKRVPRRSADSDAADRRRFIASLDPSPVRERLANAADAVEFRRTLSADRSIERAWYVFKNDAATAAIEAWLRGVLRGAGSQQL